MNVHKRISLNVGWPETVFGVHIVPSTMTNFEAMVLGYLTNGQYTEDVVHVLLKIFQKGVESQPENIVPRQIDLLAKWAARKMLKDCTIFPKNDKNKNTIVVMSFQTWNSHKNMVRAIPKNWGVREISYFLLANGDLPLPSQAKKMGHLNKGQKEVREY